LALLDNGDLVLGDTAGSDYMRYGLRLNNWREVISDNPSDFKAIWPRAKTPTPPKAKTPTPPKAKTAVGKCTKRNPSPPCGPGMIERKRPNGELCCYKDTKQNKNTVKKSPPKTSLTKPTVSLPDKKTKKCNKRNPSPPCQPGMFERKRPNGEICCYKSKK
jgi:hypothetical protein